MSPFGNLTDMHELFDVTDEREAIAKHVMEVNGGVKEIPSFADDRSPPTM